MANNTKSSNKPSVGTPKSTGGLIPTGPRRPARPQRNRASLIRTAPGRVHTAHAKPIVERCFHAMKRRSQPIPCASVGNAVPTTTDHKQARQVATTLTGVSAIAFRHALAFGSNGTSLDDAYDKFMAEVGALDVHIIDAEPSNHG